MKLYKSIVFTVVALAGILVSCNDGYETLPVDNYTIDYVFSVTDSAGLKAQGWLNSIYNELGSGHNRVNGDYLDAATDDAVSIKMSSSPDVYKIQMGQYTSANTIASDMIWGSYYEMIRKCNIFIRNIDVVPFNTKIVNALGEEATTNSVLKAECRWLRAWFYFQLLERYGGVPLMGDRVLDINDDVELPRNTFAECVEYIVSEMDAIRYQLRSYPIVNPSLNAERITDAAAMALKSRVLLYAASPLYNENPIEPGNELVGYASYDASRWARAAEAAKEFLDTQTAHKLARKYDNIFLTFWTNAVNQEVIFFRQGGNSTDIEKKNGPLGFSGNSLGNGRTNPTQNLVDAFPMLDGKKIGESKKYVYDPQNPYANRDPRLTSTVFYNGYKWLGTTLDLHQGGSHNPTSGGEYSRTGYFMHKFMGDFTAATEYSSVLHYWMIFRYAEIMLNYAEALNESLDAPNADVYDILFQIRKRAGIAAGTAKDATSYGLTQGYYGLTPDMTKEEMREVIRNERRIEMAFEEMRFYDIRRWREAEKIFETPLRGMSIVVGSNSVTYNPIDLVKVNWDNKRYFYPIPYDEVNKNNKMVQNPNWK